MGMMGGYGGGLIKLTVAGTMTLNGTLSARGARYRETYSDIYTYNGGGSGGGVNLSAGTVAGTPQLFTLVGGDGGFSSGGGGGGCALITYSSSNSITSGVVTRTAGNNGFAAGATAAEDGLYLAVQNSVNIAPTSPVIGTRTATTIPLSWTAGGGSETLYVLEQSSNGGASFSQITTVDVSDTDYTFTGLSVNTQYQFRVAAGDGVVTTSTYATSSLVYTAANQAAAPTVGTVTTSTVPLSINVNGNPTSTLYAVYSSTTAEYFTSAGVITTTPTFFTSSTWSGVARGLAASTDYIFAVIAQNGDGLNAATSTGASATTASASVGLSKTTLTTVEGGATDSYTIVLNSQPTSTVTVVVSPDANQTVSTSSIAFTSSNWNVPVTVTVTAIVQNLGNQTGTITHSVTSQSTGFHLAVVSSVTNNITGTTPTVAPTSSGGGGLGSSGSGNGLAPLITTFQSYTSGGEISGPSTAVLLDNLKKIGVAPHFLVKLPDDGNKNTQEDSAVYYVGTDGKRHAFPNSQVYFTWYPDFSGVQVIGLTQLATIPLGPNVTYKPGKKMVKFTTNSKVYTVSKGGLLRPIGSEAVATLLYGVDWNKKIDDISDAFYTNYTFGLPVNGLLDFNPAEVEASVAVPSDSLQQ